MAAMDPLIVTVSEFVSLFNQTLEYAYPSIAVEGELANFRISKNKWVYFDLKDELSNVKFFGTVYQLPGPLEDGMILRVAGSPRLHNLYGFSVTVQNLAPLGEGTIKRAAALLESKLQKEGLFDADRKRPVPSPPKRVGLIASGQSAAYHDFMKILNARWSGITIVHADVQVQGMAAPAQIIAALEHMNTHEDVEAIVITRGGGSPEDLAAFSTEQVTRAVAASRTPTLVAVGHEVDVSLAELAADLRASTPSNAAELLVPDKSYELAAFRQQAGRLHDLVIQQYQIRSEVHIELKQALINHLFQTVSNAQNNVHQKRQMLEAFNPRLALQRGFAIARADKRVVRSIENLKLKDTLDLEFIDGIAQTTITSISERGRVQS